MLCHLISAHPASVITNCLLIMVCIASAISESNCWWIMPRIFGTAIYFCIGSALRAVNTCNPPTALTRSHGIESLAVIDLLGYPRKSTAPQLQYIYFWYYHFYSPCAALEYSIRSLRLIIRFDHEPGAKQHKAADALLKQYCSVHPGQSVSTCSGRMVPKIVSRWIVLKRMGSNYQSNSSCFLVTNLQLRIYVSSPSWEIEFEPIWFYVTLACSSVRYHNLFTVFMRLDRADVLLVRFNFSRIASFPTFAELLTTGLIRLISYCAVSAQ